MQTVPAHKPHAFEAAEWRARQDLATCYRAFVHYGWCDLIYTHLSLRVPGYPEHYLINPYGLLFHEVTARNLLKVDFSGAVVSGDFPYNEAGHSIHSAVLQARPEINAVLHCHTRAGMAVSCMECGVLPLTQQANEIGALLCYHDYALATDNAAECRQLGMDLADNWAMVMHNHGLLTVGRTVGEAFHFLYQLETACKVQVDVMAAGIPPITPSATAIADMQDYAKPPAEQPADFVTMAWAAVVRLMNEKDPNHRL